MSTNVTIHQPPDITLVSSQSPPAPSRPSRRGSGRRKGQSPLDELQAFFEAGRGVNFWNWAGMVSWGQVLDGGLSPGHKLLLRERTAALIDKIEEMVSQGLKTVKEGNKASKTILELSLPLMGEGEKAEESNQININRAAVDQKIFEIRHLVRVLGDLAQAHELKKEGFQKIDELKALIT
jgi:hypothetical protein